MRIRPFQQYKLKTFKTNFMKRMKKQLFLWLMLCLSFQNGFNQTVDYSGVYKASLTFVGFKFAEQTLILKKAANNSYSGSIQAHPANENSMIKADIDTSIYELNNIYIQNGELNYKVDKMTTKPSFKGRFTDNNNRIEGKWTEETNTKKIIYIKEIGYELYDSNHNENTRNSAHINNSTDERTVLSYSDIFRARIEDVTKEQELTYAFDDHGYIDVKQLPLLDCDLANELRMGYQSDSTKVFVIPDNEVDMEELNKNFKSLSWTKFSIKTESELYAADYKKLLVFTAPLKSYKHWDKYGLPIQKTKSGFSYNNINYSNENDGIEYYSWNRIVKSGNSWQIIKKLNKSFYHGYFRFVIFQNGQLSKYGLFDNRVIDMERIVNSNYDFISTDFYNILISKKLYFETQRFDPIVINICHKLELELPDLKMEAQIHDVPNSTRLFSCFFPLTGCDILPDSFGFHGTVVMDVIHSTGSGLDFFEHESFHLVWEKQVGPPGGNNIFLNEGIQTYYSFLNDSSNLNSVIKIALKHKDFDITNLVLQKNLLDFWNSASKAYPISGLFVKMLIDKYGGLNKFKEFFVYPDTEKGYEVIYNTSAKEVIDDYYNTLNCYE